MLSCRMLVQALLAQKEAAVEKYQQLLEESRSQLQSTIGLHQAEKSKLLSQIHAQNGMVHSFEGVFFCCLFSIGDFIVFLHS